MQEGAIRSAGASGTDISKYRSGKMQGNFNTAEVKGESAQDVMRGRIHSEMARLQKVFGATRDNKKRQEDSNMGGEARLSQMKMHQLVVQLEVMEQALKKVNAGQMIGGEGAGTGDQGTKVRNDALKLFSESVTIAPRIEVIIPADASFSGRQEIFRLNAKVKALQAHVGTPGSNTDGGMTN